MSEPWKNFAYDLLAEKGQDVKELKANEFPPIPEPGFFSGMGLIVKSNLFKFALVYRALSGSRRLTHREGIGAIGTATVISNPKFPPNSFFEPDRVFPVRIRHANLSYDDDRTSDVRAASLKFADVEYGGPLDLAMNSGKSCPFWNGPTVTDFLKAKAGKKETQEWLDKNSAYLERAIENSRRAPSSYSKLSYYSQITMELMDEGGMKHHVRFRLIPADYSGQDDGMLDERDQRNYAEESDTPREGDDRPPNYLKTEFGSLLADGGEVHYVLQIQVRDVVPGESIEVYNMGREWNLSKSPWLDVARVTLFRELHADLTERLQFNVANLPGCISNPEPPSFHDYRSIAYLRESIYTATQRLRIMKFQGTASQQARVVYKFTVETMATKRGGYDGRADVAFLGSKGETAPIVLDKKRIFSDDFKEGEMSTFDLLAEDIGELWAVRFNLANREDGWCIGMITVEKRGVCVQFPCYHWIYGNATIRSGKATLIFDDCPELRALRALEKQSRRDMTQWMAWSGMPTHIAAVQHADLSRDYQFMDEKTADFYTRRDEGRFNFFFKVITEGVSNIFKEIESFHHYSTFFHFNVGQNKVPDVAERWQSDKEFGRQFLQGHHPTSIRRVDGKLPDNFPLKEERVQTVLGRKVTLQEEIDAGRIYIVDCKTLEGIPPAKGRYVAASMGLFYVNAAGDFVPLAIQLHQQPGPSNPIWTPADSINDWLFAKMWLKCADSQIHQICTHLLMTHLIVEPFAISMFRNLPRVHPVFKFLFPHMRYTMAINTIGRLKLVGSNGLADQVLSIGKGGHISYIKQCYLRFDFRRLSLPYDLAERKVDGDSLPGYYYRDDALLLWNAIHQYVNGLISVFYSNDNDVKRDTEIQEWIAEVHTFGLHQQGLPGEVDHHVPSKFSTISELVDTLTALAFTASAQHAAQNFGQYDYYSYYPNAPMTMRKPPPTKKGVKMKTIIETLGGTNEVSMQLLTVWLLATKSSDEIYLGEFPETHFVDHDAVAVIAHFQGKLKEIEEQINERNRGLEVPYTYLKPSEVPKSIAV
eukprot:m.224919 g.224919  ORF g.224919 m.224919 type:complete len:1044 (+) comp40007_c1_seq1:153-3284(+)